MSRRSGGLLLAFVSALLIATWPAESASAQAPDPDAQAMKRLEWMPQNQTGMLNVNANEGAFLRDQVIPNVLALVGWFFPQDVVDAFRSSLAHHVPLA